MFMDDEQKKMESIISIIPYKLEAKLGFFNTAQVCKNRQSVTLSQYLHLLAKTR